jgi:DNA-binding CsgD family transcriptional regulator
MRERQVAALLATASSNKLIAYHLGLAVSTVGELVTSIRRKLGVASRAELIFTLRSLDAASTKATPASDRVSDE